MKIALISYEYPPDTAYGGIATYMYQTAKMMQQRGHYVEVFTSSPHRCGTEIEDEIVINYIQEKSRDLFPKHIGNVFARRHHIVEFDILEGPELYADTREAVKLVPDIPLVIKLHSPSFFIYQLNGTGIPIHTKIRTEIGAILKGRIQSKYWLYNPKHDLECVHTLEADEVTTPCLDLGDRMIRAWCLDRTKIAHIPNSFVPSPDLLKIPVTNRNEVITFIGRLEIRKGILDLAKAIPAILKQYPHVRFQFVGSPHLSPQPGFANMRDYLEYELREYKYALEFIDRVPPSRIPEILAMTDICIFPSIWEAFGLVCLEAMSAGRCTIGSNAGGMVDILKNGKFGRLVPPHSPQTIAQVTIDLLKHPELRIELGEAARQQVLAEYNTDRIGALQEASYNRAIARRQAIGSRI